MDGVEDLGIDAELGHSRYFCPFLVTFLESFADGAEEDVDGGVWRDLVEGFLGVVGAEEEVGLQVADEAIGVLRLVDMNKGFELQSIPLEDLEVVLPLGLFEDVLQKEQFKAIHE